MKVSEIELFDENKQYICATKQEQDWVLPKLSGKNLFDISKINYLLFKIPEIVEQNEYYHLYIQFSKTDSFDEIITYNTKDNKDLFRVFTGIGISQLPSGVSSGLNYIFSDEQLQFNLSTVDSSYKYFRYHWTNDDGENFGRYGYGNRQATLQLFDASSSTVSVSNKTIEFTSENSDFVSWNENIATFIHNMNCIPLVTMYDSNLNQIMCEVSVVNNNSFLIDFQDKSIVSGTWKLILSYGVSY